MPMTARDFVTNKYNQWIDQAGRQTDRQTDRQVVISSDTNLNWFTFWADMLIQFHVALHGIQHTQIWNSSPYVVFSLEWSGFRHATG